MKAKFNEDEKVRVDACRVPWDEVAIGTVETVSINPGLEATMYIVRLESGDLVKCLEEDLEAVEDNVEEPKEEKDVESITITREDYNKVATSAICADILIEELKNPLLVFKVTPAVVKCIFMLREALFEEYKDND